MSNMFGVESVFKQVICFGFIAPWITPNARFQWLPMQLGIPGAQIPFTGFKQMCPSKRTVDVSIYLLRSAQSHFDVARCCLKDMSCLCQPPAGTDLRMAQWISALTTSDSNIVIMDMIHFPDVFRHNIVLLVCFGMSPPSLTSIACAWPFGSVFIRTWYREQKHVATISCHSTWQPASWLPLCRPVWMNLTVHPSALLVFGFRFLFS